MQQVRSLFLSDIHLGTRACQADHLLEFLRDYQAEQTYLIGDIVDFWAMHRSICWLPSHNTVVQKLLRRARHGERIVFIPGNHDEVLRDYVGNAFGGVEVLPEAIHETADGKRLLLIHGDIFDQVTRHHRWVAVLGDVAYNQLVRLNLWLSWVRRKLGCSGYWSLAGYAKRRIKTALNFIFDFEDSAIHHARERGLDGVVCGHIHWATIKEIGGLLYVNCGDWVDSCTAIVEHFDGRLELVVWGAGRPLALPAAVEDDAPQAIPSPAAEAAGIAMKASR
ncbi:UDP-2,3-diacylglucosamine diphosphatase [uncultured Zoogloea sp.]|uniref:UDP-2,3-diacylglucosamine diphosphatase n=1 Tax=uncultured Zoogloea sp. TaxID=160237 RepID=UPI00261182A3|nr:UDP-2,3-diacylglucosamine diphosphatase [uncultured Zoogloea sp.]